MLKGIDISNHQSSLDLANIKDEIDFIIARCGVTYWGKNIESEDKSFQKFYDQAKKLNIPIGAYYYSCAHNMNEAKQEVEKIKEILKGKQLEYPIYLDIENPTRQGSLNKKDLTEIVKYMASELEKEKFYVGIYASKNWLENKLDIDQLPYTIWCAQYNNKLTYSGHANMWQFTSSMKLDGYDGKLDFNHCYVPNFPELMKKHKLNGFNDNTINPTGEYINKLESKLKRIQDILNE